MIREQFESDISLVEHGLAQFKDLKGEDAKDIMQAWIRIQLQLYRYDAVLEHLNELPVAKDHFHLSYYLNIAKAGK